MEMERSFKLLNHLKACLLTESRFSMQKKAEKIKMAQTARGADFTSGNLITRAKAMIPVLIPLFVGAFRRADDLATAMEARCYRGGKGRTSLKKLMFGKGDALSLVIFVLFAAAMILPEFLM